MIETAVGIVKPEGISRVLEIFNYFEGRLAGSHRFEKTPILLMKPSPELIAEHYEVLIRNRLERIHKDAVQYFSSNVIAVRIYQGEDGFIRQGRTILGNTDPQQADFETVRGKFPGLEVDGKYVLDSLPAARKEGRTVKNSMHFSGNVSEGLIETLRFIPNFRHLVY